MKVVVGKKTSKHRRSQVKLVSIHHWVIAIAAILIVPLYGVYSDYVKHGEFRTEIVTAAFIAIVILLTIIIVIFRHANSPLSGDDE